MAKQYLFFFNDDKKTKCSLLAPIEVEILFGSRLLGTRPKKIVTESGTILAENA
jgi:hypothetical protein